VGRRAGVRDLPRRLGGCPGAAPARVLASNLVRTLVLLSPVFLAGCGLLPECICTEIRKPPEQAEAAPPAPLPVPPPPEPTPAPAPTAGPPALPAAPLPPSVSQVPLPPPGAPPPVAAPTPLAAQPRPAPPPAAAPPATPAVTPAPRYGAQLGAFRSVANANAAWPKLKARYIDLLNNVPGPLLREVDLGPKGRFVRVMAGPFNTDPEARSLCLEVQARGGFCYVQPLGR